MILHCSEEQLGMPLIMKGFPRGLLITFQQLHKSHTVQEITQSVGMK